MKDISKNIKQLRVQKNMTQDELAEKLFVTRQTVSNYETGKSHPDVGMLTRIADTLDTDVNSLIYGPAPVTKDIEKRYLFIGTALTILFGLSYAILRPITRRIAVSTFSVGWFMAVSWLLLPLFFLCAGWTLMQLAAMAMKWKPLRKNWVRWVALALILILILLFFLTLWEVSAVILNEYLYENHIRGEWIEITNEIDGSSALAWHSLPAPVPGWVSQIVSYVNLHITQKYSCAYPLLGTALWFLGIPRKKDA